MKSMTTNRLWTKEEDEAVIEMFCQGHSIHHIRLHLPRPEDTQMRTHNAINARMNLLYSKGRINIIRGDGIPREFDLEAEIKERVEEVKAEILAMIHTHIDGLLQENESGEPYRNAENHNVWGELLENFIASEEE